MTQESAIPTLVHQPTPLRIKVRAPLRSGARNSFRRNVRKGFQAAILALLLTAPAPSFADAFDILRLGWRDLLTGGANYDTNDLNIQFALLSGAKDTNFLHTNFWNNLPSANNSADLTVAFNRICSMALAYASRGSPLEANAGLAAEISSALDWMYANRYNETLSESGNWWDWQIGAPMALDDICVLMYGVLTPTQLDHYLTAVNKFTPAPSKEAANLVWQARVVAVRGALVKDASKLQLARDALTQAFKYVTTGDGFYSDGSFIQHSSHPYTGGYGASLLHNMALVLPWLNSLPNQPWNVVDPQQTNVLNWVYDSYEPLIYRGAVMDMVRGREISRPASTDRDIGHDLVLSILRLAQWTNSARLKGMVKYWAQADTSGYLMNTAPVPLISAVKQLLSDNSVIARGELTAHYQFPCANRVVHLRPGWGLGLAMSSSRISNYESINNENLHGWFTGDGMTYLYNDGLTQFSDSFWPTVDPCRLPGTTVERQPRADAANESYQSDANWVGGACLGQYGAAGMELHPASSTLSARKSWFMFDNEVVCLGAGLNSSKSYPIETTVENRRLSPFGNNLLTVNGATKPGFLGWSEAMPMPVNSWAHLQGDVPGADIGYFFPQAAALNALREARSGSFYDIDTKFGSTNRVTRNYLTLWFDHGASASNATYAYVLLPGQTALQVSNYAANPNILVLTNCPRVQAVRESTLGITALNFWEDGPCTVGAITASQKCSIILRNSGAFLEIGVSDPTQINPGRIVLDLGLSARDTNSITLDPGVTVEQWSPSVRLSVNVNKAAGRTFHAKLFIGTPSHTPPIVALTGPVDGARFPAPAAVTLLATQASGGSLSSLAFFSGSQNLAYQIAPPYRLPLSNLAAGPYTFTAVATDNGGLMSTSAPVTIAVFNAPKADSTNLALRRVPFVDVDLGPLVSEAGMPSSKLLFSVGAASNGAVALLTNRHTARLTPATNYLSSSTFTYTVTDMAGDPRSLLHYSFEPPDTPGDGLVTDTSTHGRDGRLLAVSGGAFAYTNVAPFPNFHPTSLRLIENGANGAARLIRDISDLNLSDTSWTLGLWFLRAAATNEEFLLYLGEGDGHGGSGDELEVYCSVDQTIRLAHYNILGLPDVQLASAKLPNQWHHLALAFERTNSYSGLLRLYADGALVNPAAGVTWALNRTQPLVFGGHSSTNANLTRYFNGWLDDLVLFNNALSPQEISRLATRTVAHFGGTTASNTVTITLNTPPALAAIADRTTSASATLTLTAAATDPDLPPQLLAYSLSPSPPPPVGAFIDPSTGVFTWHPGVAQADSTNRIAVVVRDDGVPSLSATQSFNIIVGTLATPYLTSPLWTNGLFQLAVTGDGSSPGYTLQASSDLANWTTLLTTNSLSLPFLWTDPSATNFPRRFYRLIPGP